MAIAPGNFYEVFWDGSFCDKGAGIGIYIVRNCQPLLKVSAPVVASDATRTEALGPPLLALLLSVFPTGTYLIKGDSMHVCNELNLKRR